jgi:O-antigen ligase
MLLKRGINPRLIAALSVMLLMLLIIVYAFWDLIMLRFETGQHAGQRILMIKIAIGVIASHPILGVGLFNFEYHSFDIFRYWRPVHNMYFRLAAEIGIPGLFFFLWFLRDILKDAYRALGFRDRLLNSIALGILCGYTGFLTAVLFGPEYQHYRLKFLFWVYAGLTVALKRIRQRELMMMERKKQQREEATLRPLTEVSRHDNR